MAAGSAQFPVLKVVFAHPGIYQIFRAYPSLQAAYACIWNHAILIRLHIWYIQQIVVLELSPGFSCLRSVERARLYPEWTGNKALTFLRILYAAFKRHLPHIAER